MGTADTHEHTQLAQRRDPERRQTPADCLHQMQCKHTDMHVYKVQVVFTPTDDFCEFMSNNFASVIYDSKSSHLRTQPSRYSPKPRNSFCLGCRSFSSTTTAHHNSQADFGFVALLCLRRFWALFSDNKLLLGHRHYNKV